MSTNRKRRMPRLITASLIVAVGIILFITYVHKAQILKLDMHEIYRAYARYLADHEGRLPDRFDDLIGPSYLRAVGAGSSGVFTGAPEGGDEFLPFHPNRPVRNSSMFSILEGGTLDDFALNGERLLRRSTGEPVLFVRTYYPGLGEGSRWLTKKVYEKLVDADK